MHIKSITPELITNDIDKTITFYSTILGLELIAKYPEKNPTWIKFKTGNSFLMFETSESLGQILPELKKKSIGGSFNIYIDVENIDVLYEKIKDHVTIIFPLIDKPFKQFAIEDANGYVLLIGEQI